MELSQSEIVAFTDDDCRVTSDWIERIIDLFAAHAAVAIVCGRVRVPEEIKRLGYAEGFEPQVREWQGRYPSLGWDWGLTANFSVRRSALEQIGDSIRCSGRVRPSDPAANPTSSFARFAPASRW